MAESPTQTGAPRIADPWGPPTPYGAGEDWPVRVDLMLEAGVSEDDVERWVPSASVLHSNGDAMDTGTTSSTYVSSPSYGTSIPP